jgi:DNA polymerase-4
MKNCGDIQKHDPAQLRRWFGSRAHDLSELARGIDNRPVEPDSERKSLTVEETYQSDLKNQDECLRELPSLYEEWQMRMRKFAAKNKDSQIRGWVVKIKFHDFKATTHEISARSWPSLEDFARLLKEAYARREEPIRLLGLGVRLGSSSPQTQNTPQLALFDATPNA